MEQYKIDTKKAAERQAKYDKASYKQKQEVDKYTKIGKAMLLGAAVTTDLPNSDTVTNGSIPMRILKQIINHTNVKWPMLEDISYEQVANGIFDITYKNTLEGDTTTTAYSPVLIEDFNADQLPSARLVFKVDSDYHFKLQLPYGVLNQIFLNQGNFLTFFHDFTWNLAIELGKLRLKQFLTSIDSLVVATATAGKVVPINLTYDSTVSMEEQTRLGYGEFVKQILRLKTPSTTTPLDSTIGGKFTKPLLNSYQPSELLIYVDYKYYADLKAYLYSGAYHLNEAKIIDMALKPINLTDLQTALGITLANIGDAAAIVISKGKANEEPLYGQFYQYQGTTTTTTPKMYNVVHYYQKWSDWVNPIGHLSIYKLNPTAPTA